MYNAHIEHEEYAKFVTQSYSLEDAVAQYRRRYSLNPPPGFDAWYAYATARSALIIDDYDQIWKDLLPFWEISPQTLRLQTWEMVANPWNEIGGVSIRDGVASVQENILPTHRWMVEGAAGLINTFAEWLPDMDLAFNLNDESRVSVPHGILQQLHRWARSSEHKPGTASFSPSRASSWPPMTSETIETTEFEDCAFRSSFEQYGSISCPSSSPARTSRYHDHTTICTSCTAPHSLGQFVSNWSLAGNPCHQPDLAHYHGFYLSPAAFKGSQTLLPVFSQSKPAGFQDILYPSPWNYMDKVKYEPSDEHPDQDFIMKQNVLFWRGATSEGVSAEGTWRGMVRQRLVHLANNLTASSYDSTVLLLPDPGHRGRLSYQTFRGTDLPSLGLRADVRIVDHIARCGGDHDCEDQLAEFSVVSPTTFEDHWQYRYLFDVDGAGFSGRFLPFLQSKSLPFKTALFREWYDERLTAWKHFVPQDLRLHGVWSTLAYFAGVEGRVKGQDISYGSHVKEGERIAEAGREWAGKVLRKEDMEIYFFRLLLEWGRLTDDNRDELGYVYSV